MPIPDVYDSKGNKLVGYQGYSDGYISTVIKNCNALLDAEGVK